MVSTLLEKHTYIPGLIFHLHRVFCPPVQMRTFVPVGATNRYKCPLIWARWGLIQPNWYKGLTFVSVAGSDWYKREAITFVPGEDTTQYKCRHMCTGPCLVLVQMCNGYNSFFPSAQAPPHSSSSSLQLKLTIPNGTLGCFCPICDDFSTVSLIEVV
jgi:hypothetical protein